MTHAELTLGGLSSQSEQQASSILMAAIPEHPRPPSSQQAVTSNIQRSPSVHSNNSALDGKTLDKSLLINHLASQLHAGEDTLLLPPSEEATPMKKNVNCVNNYVFTNPDLKTTKSLVVTTGGSSVQTAI